METGFPYSSFNLDKQCTLLFMLSSNINTILENWENPLIPPKTHMLPNYHYNENTTSEPTTTF